MYTEIGSLQVFTAEWVPGGNTDIRKPSVTDRMWKRGNMYRSQDVVTRQYVQRARKKTTA